METDYRNFLIKHDSHFLGPPDQMDLAGGMLPIQEGLRTIWGSTALAGKVRGVQHHRKYTPIVAWELSGTLILRDDMGRTVVSARPCQLTRNEARTLWEASDRLTSLLSGFGVRVVHDGDWIYSINRKVEDDDYPGRTYIEEGELCYTQQSTTKVIWHELYGAGWQLDNRHISSLIEAQARLVPLYNETNRLY